MKYLLLLLSSVLKLSSLVHLLNNEGQSIRLLEMSTNSKQFIDYANLRKSNLHFRSILHDNQHPKLLTPFDKINIAFGFIEISRK